jgi:hypothetical protein
MNIKIPLSALGMPDESGEMIMPEAGDTVSVTIDGKLGKITGQNATVTVEMVNGQPLDGEAAPEAPAEEMPTREGLMAALQEQDAAGY